MPFVEVTPDVDIFVPKKAKAAKGRRIEIILSGNPTDFVTVQSTKSMAEVSLI